MRRISQIYYVDNYPISEQYDARAIFIHHEHQNIPFGDMSSKLSTSELQEAAAQDLFHCHVNVLLGINFLTWYGLGNSNMNIFSFWMCYYLISCSFIFLKNQNQTKRKDPASSVQDQGKMFHRAIILIISFANTVTEPFSV